MAVAAESIPEIKGEEARRREKLSAGKVANHGNNYYASSHKNGWA
jgi:hypothetical protein